jgi:hypothetical protein
VSELAYWSTSGEVVFAALLGGLSRVLGLLAGTTVFDFWEWNVRWRCWLGAGST